MNILDENFTSPQRERLRRWRIPVRHIGYDIAAKGWDDERIIPFLLTLTRPTFFTKDADYFKPRLAHARYCLVHLAVRRAEMAQYTRQFL